MPDASHTVSGQLPRQLDVVIVGAGLAGLYAIHRLRKIGLKVRAYEAGSGVGGTWFWNRYPGARCDVESLEYSYSFDDQLQQDWKWPERYGTQPEILKYINHVADRFDLRRDVQLNTRIKSAVFDGQENAWVVKTDNEEIHARYCVMAAGNLSTPRVPDFKGLKDFKGKWYHSGLWPHEGVDFSGLRVGVIGTGSSGVQMIPLIAQQAKHLTVFQRTANFSLPARNEPMPEEKERQHKAEYPERRRAAYDTPFAIAGYPKPTKSALEAAEEERNKAFEAKWQEGGSISYLYSYTDLLVNKASNDIASEFVRNKIRSMVTDQKTAELLAPKDHPIGTKRLCLDTNYYETYNRQNVSLVGVRSDPIDAITATGLKLKSGAAFELDAIVFATGFDAMTGALNEIDVRTTDGAVLRSHWEGGPLTYLGLMIAGFPNMFVVTGPGSPGVKTQMIASIEQHVDWIADAIDHLGKHQLDRIEPTATAETDWVDHVNKVADSTLYPLANSWYMGANIPGKPRVFMPYVGGFDRYKKHCDAVAAQGYRGFTLSRHETVAA
ncbi:MAG TPA: NAD(P)/FAD-dependent oxidoreductase [Reyranella sp.]|jgi:cyclohexanone monooxygenase